MKEEYDALMKNGTWSLVPRASNTNVVDDKWVYMKQPLGFSDPQRPNHVCLLHKSLYGLKQAPRVWFERLSMPLFDLGFNGPKTNLFLFIYSHGDTLLYILVYVDDIIVTSNNKGTIDNIIYQLRSAFALKDLGSLNYFLGIEIVPHVPGILLSQKKYILELLQSVGLSNYNPVSSPMITSSSLSLDDSTAFSNPVCQYMHAPTKNCWSAVEWILRYLHGTVEHDADWAGDSDDRRSTGDLLYILEKVAQGDLRVQHISTHDQIADIFTKPVPTPRFLFLRSKLQVVTRP
nr:hypothetical protein [Tanacetum cinerariifolium]